MGRFVVLAVLAVFLMGCGAGGVQNVEGSWHLEDGGVDAGLGEVRTPLATPTANVTFTPSSVPTATVDYAGTAVFAVQTADEARRLNTQATAEYEQRLQEQMRLTAESDVRDFEMYGWTATAALTAAPATATQQAVLNTQIAAQQTLAVVQITQTYEAPAKLIEMQQAEDYVQYAPMRIFGEAIFKLAVFCFSATFFVLALWVLKQPHWNKKVAGEMLDDYINDKGQSQVEVKKEASLYRLDVTNVELKDEAGGYTKILRFAVPCSPDALTELAQGLVSGTKTFGINSWEGSESENWTRARIKAMRHFLQLNKFAESAGGGRLHVNDLGKKFLMAWLESRNLPADYRFDEHAVSVK